MIEEVASRWCCKVCTVWRWWRFACPVLRLLRRGPLNRACNVWLGDGCTRLLSRSGIGVALGYGHCWEAYAKNNIYKPTLGWTHDLANNQRPIVSFYEQPGNKPRFDHPDHALIHQESLELAMKTEEHPLERPRGFRYLCNPTITPRRGNVTS